MAQPTPHPSPPSQSRGPLGLKQGLGPQCWALYRDPSVCELKPLTGCVEVCRTSVGRGHFTGVVRTQGVNARKALSKALSSE